MTDEFLSDSYLVEKLKLLHEQGERAKLIAQMVNLGLLGSNAEWEEGMIRIIGEEQSRFFPEQ